MAAITSAQSGLWSATSTWVGGVVPGAADTVTIAATHIVTVDGTYTTGGDTGGGFVVRGTLKASRTVNSSLAVRANINVAQSGAGFDFGTNSDPIPQGVTAELVVNASATPAANKYNISSPGGVNGVFFRFCGAPKTRNAFLTAPVSAGATSIQVTDASGWVVGDSLFLEQPTNDVLQTQTVTITSISGTTIGVSAITLARVSGLAVSNISCNVLLRSQTSTAASTNYFRCSTSPSATGIVEVRNCEIRDIGYLYLDYPSSNNVVVANTPTFNSCYVSGTSSSRSMIGGVFGTYEMAYSNNILIGGVGYTQQNLLEPNLSFATVTNSVFYMLGTTAFSGAFGYNGTWGLNVTNCRLNGYWGCVTQSTAGLQTFTNCRFRSKFNELYSGGQANIQFNNCDFLSQSGAKYIKLNFNASGSVNIQNPTVDDVTKLNPNANYSTMRVNAYSINGVFNANRSYTYNCAAINQNTVVNRATNNIALQLNNSQTTGQYTFSFQGITGVAQRIVGYLRHDTTYGTSNPPSISFSGAGVSGSFTSSSPVNVWEKFDITLTPTSVGTITATVNFAGAAGGTAYLDGVYQFPFITDSWIYGFQKLPQANSVVDSNITLSESAVAALSSCSTFDDLYDAATYYSIVNGPTSGSYAVIVDANGADLAFGSNSVTINSGAGSVFSYAGTTATVKASALTSGAKFKSMSASSFTMTTPVTNTTLTGNVTQAAPTDLTGVNIVGNITYNTDTDITVTFTDCTVSGTISNSGTGLVKVVRAGKTPWLTAGSNVSNIALVSVTTSDDLPLSTYIGKNNNTDLGWVSMDAARVLEVAQGDYFDIYAISYGYQAGLFYATADDFTTFNIALNPETFVNTELSTTTRDYIVSKLSTYLDGNTRVPLAVEEDLRSYLPPEVLNAIHYFVATEGYYQGAAVIYGGSIDGFKFIQGGVYINNSAFYFKVNDSITTPTNLGYLLPIFIDVNPDVYTAYPDYSIVEMNTSNIVLQYSPWTKITAEISAVDKNDIRNGLAMESSVDAIPLDVLSAMNESPPNVNINRINGLEISGSGTTADPWKPV